MAQRHEIERGMWCITLICATFLAVGADPVTNGACFEACTTECLSSGVLSASQWPSWDGYNGFKVSVRMAAHLTRQHNMYHCPAAPKLISGLAALSLRYGMRVSHRLIRFIERFKLLEHASTVIGHYTSARTAYIRINRPWTLPMEISAEAGGTACGDRSHGSWRES